MLFGRYSLEQINARVQENPEILDFGGMRDESYSFFGAPAFYLNEYYLIAYKYLFNTENSTAKEDTERAFQNIVKLTQKLRIALFDLNYNVSLTGSSLDYESRDTFFIQIDKLDDSSLISISLLSFNFRRRFPFPHMQGNLFGKFSRFPLSNINRWNNYLYPLFKTTNNVFLKYLNDNSPLRPDMESIFNLRSVATFRPAPFPKDNETIDEKRIRLDIQEQDLQLQAAVQVTRYIAAKLMKQLNINDFRNLHEVLPRDIWNQLQEKMLENNDQMH